MKKILKYIPILPVSALIFYLAILLFWNLGVIPSPETVVNWLKGLYENYGMIGLFIATLTEGTVYVGLYSPGSLIIALSVILSDGTAKSFLMISLVVAFALTITSIVNYSIGRFFASRKRESSQVKKIASKGFFFSFFMPIFLAFYFFHAGIKKENPLKLVLVPIIMIPYGFLCAELIYMLRDPFMKSVNDPYAVIILVSIWIAIAFAIQYYEKKKSILNNTVP